MEKRKFGTTNMKVTVLGYGAMELAKLSEKEAVVLLNKVLDEGINFIDTSPCYGISEEYIGAAVSGRRNEFILSTKCGCVVKPEGVSHTFDRPTFMGNIEHSLKMMKTDYVDILQIHAPMPQDIPGGENDDMILAMQEMKRDGKIRDVCITFKNSGHSDPKYPDIYSYECLKAFKDWKCFDVIQLVYGGLTRKCEAGIDALKAAGKGVIARGSMKKYQSNYDELFEKAGLSSLLETGETPSSLLLRYTISHPGLTTAIVGTRSADHLMANIHAANKGVLTPEVYAKAKAMMDSVGQVSLSQMR